MRITQAQLRKIIREERARLEERGVSGAAGTVDVLKLRSGPGRRGVAQTLGHLDQARTKLTEIASMDPSIAEVLSMVEQAIEMLEGVQGSTETRLAR